MDELYRSIEKAIRDSGYPKAIDGEEFYRDISEEAEDRDEGKYLFVIKKTETLIYEGCMDIFENEFDLHFVNIREGDEVYHVDFDI